MVLPHLAFNKQALTIRIDIRTRFNSVSGLQIRGQMAA